MVTFPSRIKIELRRSRASGLIAAVSDDLPGLMTVAEDIDEVERHLSGAVQQLIKAQFGADVCVEWIGGDDDEEFVRLSEPLVCELLSA